jgi:hypothetical protein
MRMSPLEKNQTNLFASCIDFPTIVKDAVDVFGSLCANKVVKLGSMALDTWLSLLLSGGKPHAGWTMPHLKTDVDMSRLGVCPAPIVRSNISHGAQGGG